MLEEPFVEIENQEDLEEADRTIVIGPAKDLNWIGVYDEYSEDSKEAWIDLGQKLSERLKGVTLGVYCDEYLEMYLYRQGKVADHYLKNPEYEEYLKNPEYYVDDPENPDETHIPTKSIEPNPLEWASFLTPGKTIEELTNVFLTQDWILLQDRLWEAANLLGLDLENLAGYYHLDKTDSAFIKLAFKSTETPKYAAKKEGPPALEIGVGDGANNFGKGQELPRGMITVRSSGGPSTGLRIVVWGSAIDQELLNLSLVRLYPPQVKRFDLGEGPRFMEYQFKKGDSESNKIYYLDLPEFEIPASLANPKDAAATHPFWRYLDAENLTEFSIKLVGRSIRTGKGTLKVSFLPFANFEEGAATWAIPLVIR